MPRSWGDGRARPAGACRKPRGRSGRARGGGRRRVRGPEGLEPGRGAQGARLGRAGGRTAAGRFGRPKAPGRAQHHPEAAGARSTLREHPRPPRSRDRRSHRQRRRDPVGAAAAVPGPRPDGLDRLRRTDGCGCRFLPGPGRFRRRPAGNGEPCGDARDPSRPGNLTGDHDPHGRGVHPPREVLDAELRAPEAVAVPRRPSLRGRRARAICQTAPSAGCGRPGA